MTRPIWRRPFDSLAYRWAPFWRFVAQRAHLHLGPRTTSETLRFVTFGGAAHLPMMRECLASLARSWPELPRLTVVVDGNPPLAPFRRALEWWPADFEILAWEEMAHRVPRSSARPDLEHLLRFAHREPMGRKMAAVVASALAGPTLYSDIDVLWFRKPASLDRFQKSAGAQLVLSPDLVPAYDDRLVPGRLPRLVAPPFRCAGVMFAQGDFLAAAGVEDLLAFAAEEGIGLTEQTILAEADRRLDGSRWVDDEIALHVEDRFRLSPSYPDRPWAARHYVGQVRHLFWRDAAALARKP